jgi:hypothetical protein
MANRWYVKLGDEELGPLSDSGLDRLIEAGGIQGDTLVRNGPSTPWTPVQAVPGLMAKLARPSPPSGGGSQTSPPKGPPPRPAPPPPVVMLPATAVPAASAARRFGKLELGLGVAACLIAFAAAWTAAHLASSRMGSSAAKSSGAAGQLAALKQETDLLQQELLSARRQLDDLRRAPPQSPVSPPPSSASPTVDLAAERKSLAEAIARDWANQEDAAARLRYELSHVIDPALDAVASEPYKSQADELLRRKLPEVERELAAADQAQLAKRKQELERQQSELRQKTQQLLVDAKAAIKRCDLEQGGELLKQYIASGYAERSDDAVAVLKQSTSAKPLAVAADVQDLSDQQVSEMASTERLPAVWPRRYSDPDVAEAVRQMAVRLAKCMHGSVRSGEFLKREVADQNAYELSPLRKSQFVRDVSFLDIERDLRPTKVAELVDAYGFFRLADLAPQIDDSLNLRLNRLLADETERTIERLARGEFEFESVGDLCRKARQMAGDAWPADDAALPYAGHWTSRDRWHLYIDPWRDAIVYRKSSPAVTFEQQVCKLAPGYLVGCERRTSGVVDASLSPAQNPFWKERFDEDKDELPEIDGPEANKIVALTLYVLKPGESKTLRLFRRYKNPVQSVRNQEIKGQAFWKSLGDESLYRPYEDVYRYVNDKLAPE